MRRILCVLAAVVAWLIAAPTALATIQRASADGITATFSFRGSFPNYHGDRLTIARHGRVVYARPVVSGFCGTLCAPGDPSARGASVRILDIEHDRRPDVLLSLFSGGAHCCSIEQIFTWNSVRRAYVKTERNFGDPGFRIADLSHDGRYEFVTADDTFAYAFTGYAGSGMPLEILTYAAGRYHNVTARYPALIAHDAAGWLSVYKSLRRQRWQGSTGVIAAWAADEDRLGNSAAVATYLSAQAALGHLNSGMGYGYPSGRRFITALDRFLRRLGYLH